MKKNRNYLFFITPGFVVYTIFAIIPILYQEIDGFITGKSTMDDWAGFVETLKSQGTEELEQIFNDAYARTK